MSIKIRAANRVFQKKIIHRAINSSGIRDTARVFDISKGTVIGTLKKQEYKLISVNPDFYGTDKSLSVRIIQVCYETEWDEQWSYVSKKALLAPLNIQRYYTDDRGAYERHIDEEKHKVGKRNTQKIERKNLNFRTWIKGLARKTIRFFKAQKDAWYRH